LVEKKIETNNFKKLQDRTHYLGCDPRDVFMGSTAVRMIAL